MALTARIVVALGAAFWIWHRANNPGLLTEDDLGLAMVDLSDEIKEWEQQHQFGYTAGEVSEEFGANFEPKLLRFCEELKRRRSMVDSEFPTAPHTRSDIRRWAERIRGLEYECMGGRC